MGPASKTYSFAHRATELWDLFRNSLGTALCYVERWPTSCALWTLQPYLKINAVGQEHRVFGLSPLAFEHLLWARSSAGRWNLAAGHRLAEASFQVSYRCHSDARSSGCFAGSRDFDHGSIADFLLILAVKSARYDMAALRALER